MAVIHSDVKGVALCMQNMDKRKATERGFLTKEASVITCKQCKYVLSRRFQREVTLYQFPYLKNGSEVRSIIGAQEGVNHAQNTDTDREAGKD